MNREHGTKKNSMVVCDKAVTDLDRPMKDRPKDHRDVTHRQKKIPTSTVLISVGDECEGRRDVAGPAVAAGRRAVRRRAAPVGVGRARGHGWGRGVGHRWGRGRGARAAGGGARAAAHLHRRRAALRHHADARHAGRAPRRALRPGDARGAAHPADAPALDALAEGERAPRAGRRLQGGARQRHRRLLPRGDRAPRRAGAAPLQQGPARHQDGHLRARAVPQLQVSVHGARRSRHRPLDHLPKGHHHGLRPVQPQAVHDQVEPRGGVDVPAVQVDGRGQVPAGAVRGAGAAARGDAAPRAGLPRPALGRGRAAPRALHQPAQRRRPLQRGAVVGPGGAAGEPRRARQVGQRRAGRRARRYGRAGPHAVGAGLRPVGLPAALRRAAGAQPRRPRARAAPAVADSAGAASLRYLGDRNERFRRCPNTTRSSRV